ncbi:MAG TPA: NADH-quinone oxidoreductase subunit J [Verrucomicrobiae bacterium]|jgi:NADH-quinone oxidoreductase subunit J|nr:NADH-quinone oxidoreductase subunit J [Verrucomicrobiae bacterium]
MDVLNTIVNAGIYALMGLGVIAALGAVTCRNLFHAGLCLAVVLIVVAGTYLSVGAEFLAMIQVLIYVGAVLTLIIYAVMLTARLSGGEASASNGQAGPVFAACALFLAFMAPRLMKTPWPVSPAALSATLSVNGLGQSLMTTYVFPFEVLGILLFAVLIGAIVVARKDKA